MLKASPDRRAVRRRQVAQQRLGREAAKSVRFGELYRRYSNSSDHNNRSTGEALAALGNFTPQELEAMHNAVLMAMDNPPTP